MSTTLRHLAWFALGLFALDQLILHVGKRWDPTEKTDRGFYQSLSTGRDWDTVLVGNCRAMALDPELLSHGLRQRVLNAGTSAEALGMMAFNLNLILSHVHDRSVLLVLDDWVLSAPLEEAQEELKRRLPYWEFLGQSEADFLDRTFAISGLTRAFSRSGLFRFRGKGPAILKTLYSSLLGKSYTPPTAHTVDVEGSRFNPAQFHALQTRRWTPNQKAVTLVRNFLEKASQRNIRTTVVLAPMHGVRATPQVRTQIALLVKSLTKPTQARFFNFLTGHDEWTLADGLWKDPGHLTREGGRLFSQAVIRSLAQQ